MGKVFTAIVSTLMLVAGLMFSAVLLALAGIAILIGFGYFWWKTRALRKTLRERESPPVFHGQVFEGEVVIVEEEPCSTKGTALPKHPAHRP